MILIQWLFWGSLGLILYTYIGFPLLLVIRGRWQRHPVKKADIMPRVSLVIVAHNEAAHIGAKLENVLALDYPQTQLEIIVASDGSSDGTNEIVTRYAPVHSPNARPYTRSYLEDGGSLALGLVLGAAAARPLRRAVLWCHRSFWTQSAEGSRFVERTLTVVTTLRQQKRDVLDYLTVACAAAIRGDQPPSLLPKPSAIDPVS